MTTKWHSPNPWRCWERSTLAGVLNGPDGLLVRVALRDRRSGVFQTEFRWPALERLGPNDYHGKYAQITLRFGEARWSFEMSGDDECVYLLVRSLDPKTSNDVTLQLETLFLRDNGGALVTREEYVIARRGPSAWSVHSPSPNAIRRGTTLVASLRRPFVAVIEPASRSESRLENRSEAERVPAPDTAPPTSREREIAAKIAGARRAYLERFNCVPRELFWLYAGVPYGIGWNMIWAADRREPVQVCSRDWCVHGNYGDWVLFNWDTFLVVAAAADYDPALAHQIAGPQMSVQTEDGLIPGIACPLGISGDRAMPPVASLMLWKTYRRTQDRSFVDQYYEPLTRYHAWWLRNRDGNADGLLEWGSNPYPTPHPQWQAHTNWAARYEAGMDNHPAWDDVVFNPKTNTQEQSDVGLNALHGADARCLAEMAELLGRSDDARRYRAEADAVAARIESRLWNDAIGLWLNRGWDGAWNERASPCCFYPLLLPGVDPARARRAIADHLEAPRRFGGRYAMPICPRDDPAYPEQYYVRGRIWPPHTYLVHIALREAGCEDAAARLARGCLETVRAEWLEQGHLHENYNADTADGEDTAESDPVYSFGVLLPFLVWSQLRDIRIDGQEMTAAPEVFDEFLDHDGELRKRVDPLDEYPGL